MRQLREVEEAKAVMREGMEWSVIRWLKEKKRVRKIADRANEAVDKLNREVKASWTRELQQAYAAVANRSPDEERGELVAFAEKVRRADEAAHRARVEAQKTFDDAEEQLSARLAREGCSKAIHQWELDEQAIRVAEKAARAS